MTAPRFVYSVAISTDGFIAPADGSVDWLAEYSPPEDEFNALMAATRVILFGRTTFDQAISFGGPWPYAGKRCLVLTRRPPPASLPPDVQVEFVTGPVPGLCERLRAELAALPEGPRDVWVIGGADIAGQVLAAGELDELELGIIPVLLGFGTRLFPDRDHPPHPLRLIGQRMTSNGMTMLRYAVAR